MASWANTIASTEAVEILCGNFDMLGILIGRFDFFHKCVMVDI